MHPLTRELALRQACSDGNPRVVVDTRTMFIVTPEGEIWRIFDSQGTDGEPRVTPRNEPGIVARIFIKTGEERPYCIYRFGLGESRSTSPHRLFLQLERAKAGDAQAA
jgi:hypothetical protein